MTASPMAARCPGKVNLALEILGRREDGFHEIRTVFQAIDLWDRLEARPARELRLTCDDPGLPCDGRNLVLRAAEALRRFAARGDAGADLVLRKAIPSAAGLGGGSSDAAGALLLLSRLWQVDLAIEDLMEIASEIGSDVPFFLVGGTALGEGRGERLRRLPDWDPRPILLGIPPFGVSTAEAYAAWRSALTPLRGDVTVECLRDGKCTTDKDLSVGRNDLERAVFEKLPELAAFKGELEDLGAAPAMMSGSGSTVFGVFEDLGTLKAARRSLGERWGGWRLLETTATTRAAHVTDGLRGGARRQGSAA